MKKKKQGRALQEVTFRVGDFTRPWMGPSLRKKWLGGIRTKVSCRSDDIDNDEAWCIVEEGEDYWTHTEPSSNCQMSKHSESMTELDEINADSYLGHWEPWLEH